MGIIKVGFWVILSGIVLEGSEIRGSSSEDSSSSGDDVFAVDEAETSIYGEEKRQRLLARRKAQTEQEKLERDVSAFFLSEKERSVGKGMEEVALKSVLFPWLLNCHLKTSVTCSQEYLNKFYIAVRARLEQ